MNCLRLPKSILLLFLSIAWSVLALAQDHVVTGKVIDKETGKPVEGVSVKVKNSNIGTTTNADGVFSIKVPSTESVLTITSVGFLVYEVKAGEGPHSISLTQTDSKMDEVIVVEYLLSEEMHSWQAGRTYHSHNADKNQQ